MVLSGRWEEGVGQMLLSWEEGRRIGPRPCLRHSGDGILRALDERGFLDQWDRKTQRLKKVKS